MEATCRTPRRPALEYLRHIAELQGTSRFEEWLGTVQQSFVPFSSSAVVMLIGHPGSVKHVASAKRYQRLITSMFAQPIPSVRIILLQESVLSL